jgi:thiamine-phosphate pyrophosphorylase
LSLPPLYAVLDVEIAANHGWTVPDLARACVAGGARLLQVRGKRVPSGRLLELVDEIVDDTASIGSIVVVNDRADVARIAHAAGVHVGQDDLSAADARALLGPSTLVGLSTHTRTQVDVALAEPISYLAVGPVFATNTKDTGFAPVGLELVRYAAECPDAGQNRAGGPLPIVAIGGITLDHAAKVLAAGATSVAVITDLFATGNPERRTRQFVETLKQGHP